MLGQHTTAAGAAGIRPSLQNLRAGDQVLVWCGATEKNIWQRVAEVSRVNGRLKIRVEKTDFFFDEGIVISCQTQEPDAVPVFYGYYCHIEYTTELPLSGTPLCAVQTPLGLVLAFVRRLPGGRVRLDIFDASGGNAGAQFYLASEIEMVGNVILKSSTGARRSAA